MRKIQRYKEPQNAEVQRKTHSALGERASQTGQRQIKKRVELFHVSTLYALLQCSHERRHGHCAIDCPLHEFSKLQAFVFVAMLSQERIEEGSAGAC